MFLLLDLSYIYLGTGCAVGARVKAQLGVSKLKTPGHLAMWAPDADVEDESGMLGGGADPTKIDTTGAPAYLGA